MVKEAQTPDEKDSPSILKEFRIKELKDNRDLLIDQMRNIFTLKHLSENPVTIMNLGISRKFRELLVYREMEFSDDDLLWLVQEEIKNQEYSEFKEEILSQTP